MSKILVEVHVPVAGRTVDVLIPYELRLGQVTRLIETLLASDITYGGESVRGAVLCDGSTGEPLPPDHSARQAGLRNGARLLII